MNTSIVEVLRGPLESALTPTIGVQHESGRGVAAGHRRIEGGVDELGTEVISERVADDLAGEDVEHRGKIGEAVSGRDVGDVCDPEAIRCRSGEAALDEIGCCDRRTIRLGGAAPSAPVTTFDPGRSHEPGDPFPRRRDAVLDAKLSMDARRSVGAAAPRMDPSDQ